MFFLFVKADFGHPYRHVDLTREVIKDASTGSIYMGTMVMNRLLPEGSVVGSWNAGLIGYYSRFPVVNLDGLVNSYGYLRAQKKEGAAATFLTRFGLTHMTDIGFAGASAPQLLFESVPIDVGWWNRSTEILRFRIWPAGPPGGGVDRSEWFWERMKLHLEPQAGGVGLLVDGRTAQAFAKDCTPDELVAWTWGADQKDTVFTPWTKTSIGFCTSFIVLPHGALPHRVQAAAMTADAYLANRVGERLPAIRSGFDVYLVENRLFYVKEPCGQEDAEAPFFVHAYPVVPDGLTAHRRRYGFDNLDFKLTEHGNNRPEWDEPGMRVGGTCLAEIPLPEYDVATIRTGQFVVTEDGVRNLWTGEIRFRW